MKISHLNEGLADMIKALGGSAPGTMDPNEKHARINQSAIDATKKDFQAKLINGLKSSIGVTVSGDPNQPISWESASSSTGSNVAPNSGSSTTGNTISDIMSAMDGLSDQERNRIIRLIARRNMRRR